MSSAKRIKELEELINNYEYHYRVLDSPIISDQQFDKLMNELKALSKEHPELVSEDSPLNKIGEVLVDGFEKVTHERIMGSIDNVYSCDELLEWGLKLGSGTIFTLDDKYDGISGSIIYENSILTQAATRGDGKIGDNITANAKMVWNVPRKLEMAGVNKLEVRGEFVIFKRDFLRINEETDAEYKNPRNLVSGTMKSLNSKVVRDRYVHFIPFQAFADGEEVEVPHKSFGRINNQTFVIGDIHEIVAHVKRIEESEEYKYKDYMVDGLVVKVKDMAKREELGYTSKYPKWAIAFKFKQDTAKTIVRDIVWQVGKEVLTPVAIFDPTELGGSTITRASIHNVSQLKRLNIQIGDTIEIEKAGFIIPYINENVTDHGDELVVTIPTHCPVCNTPTEITKTDVAESLICVNEDCIAKKYVFFEKFVKALGIDGIGGKLIENLINDKLVSNFSDMYSLTMDDLLRVERMGKKGATKILNNIKNSTTQPLKNVLRAMGIKHVGNSSSEKLADVVKTFDGFLAISYQEMMNIEDFGVETANEIVAYREKHAEELQRIKNIFTLEKEAETTDELSGKTFVVTGKATVGRKEIETAIKAKGGKVTGSVSKKVDYLVLGSLEAPDFTSSKTKKAATLDVKIVDEFFIL